MRVSSEQIAQQLTRELKPLYTVFGDEPLLALEATDRIRAKARADGYVEREILTTDDDTLQTLSPKRPKMVTKHKAQSDSDIPF